MRLLLLTLATSLIMAVFFVHSAFAHASEPRLEISVDRISPGGVVDVRGVGFDYEEIVTLVLIGSQGEIALGEVIADTEGIFLNTVVLPIDLIEGTYYFRGTTTHHYTLSPALTVQGSAILAEGEGEEERWEEEDPLPYAIPTYPPGLVPGVAPGVTQPVPVAESESSAVNNPLIAVITTVALVVGALFMVVRLRRRQ